MKQCAPRDPQRVPKPKYEATAPQAIQFGTTKERGEQERLPQGGPSFGPFVGALDSR